ncbi:MAG: hypothetical protein ABEJ56_04940 [Candidatus Nanohaloarchaea archaeon]
MWERVEEQESESVPRKWKHIKTGETVTVERFENGTWDTFRGERLIENYDHREEAIARGREIVS